MSKYRGPDPKNLDEHYETPRFAVHRLLEQLSDEQRAAFRGHVLSPCAGTGAITKHVNSFFGRGYVERWTLIEKQKFFMGQLEALAAREEGKKRRSKYKIINGNALLLSHTVGRPVPVDVLIDNPPFSRALAFLLKYRDVPDDLYLLQRTSWLETADRHPILQNDMPNTYVLPQRPSFTSDNGTDAASYSWFHWDRERRKVGTIRLLDLTESDDRK